MKMLQNFVVAVLVMCLGVPGGLLAAEFTITVIPERFPAGANINITMAADNILQQPTSFSLMLKRNNLADTPLFTAKADGCRAFRADIKQLQCDYARAKFKIEIRNYHQSISEVYMKVDGPDPDQSEPVKLKYFVAPIGLLIKVNNKTVKAGSRVRMETHFVGGKNHLANFSWHGPSSSRRFNSHGSTSVISFTAKPADKGKWRCAAHYESRQGGVFEAVVSLNVEYAPLVYTRRTASSVGLGGGVILKANISANPEPGEVYWEKCGKKINTRGVIQNTKSTCWLKLEKFTCTDFGEYTCVAVNKIGRGEANIDVNRDPDDESRRRDQEFLEMKEAMENFRKATIGLGFLLTDTIAAFCGFLYCWYWCRKRICDLDCQRCKEYRGRFIRHRQTDRN